MISKTITITNKLGLHARPAALLTKTACLFECDIRLRKGTKLIDAKSILAVMTLAAKCGDTIDVLIDGSNEQSAMQSIVALADSRFGESE